MLDVTRSQFADLSVAELIQLRHEVERLILKKIDAEEKRLLDNLRVIQSYRTEEKLSPEHLRRDKKATRAKAVPKYRDPQTGATWAGRGVQPRWMRKAIEAGQRRDDFLITS